MTDSGEGGGSAAASERGGEAEPAPETAYHLRLQPAEVTVAGSALRLLIADEAHEPEIRSLARAVLDGLARGVGEDGLLELPLTAREMKIAHTAVKLLHDDLGREEAEERRVLAQILEKLPNEHAIRAIALD